jgi:intracellular sulfur oxidation DsrE/DsrF family protein
MNRRSLLAFLGLGAAAAPALASQQKSSAKHSVVLQVSDKDPVRWQLALNNARNVQSDLGAENVQIEIVAYGPGLDMLKAESPVAGGLAGALDASVRLIACQNTMHNTKVSPDDMYSGISYVPAGVTHIMKRQREGWAYIRP